MSHSVGEGDRMNPGSGPKTVTTRFVWVPHGPAGGWLLLHRTVRRGATGETADEFWRTEKISPEAAAADAFQDSTPEWHRIVTGEPVPFLLWPFFLAAVTDRELPALREQIARSVIRPLADIHAEVDAGPGGGVLAAPRITLAGDPIGPGHRDLDLDGCDLGDLDATGRRSALLAAVDDRIRLSGSGRADDDRTVWINRFVARGEASAPPLGRVLLDEEVRRAIAALMAAPQDDARRRAVVAEARRHGWSLAAEPLHLAGPQVRPGFLGRLVYFCHESSTVHRIATMPACQEAVRGHDGLGAALAAYLCPLDPSARDARTVREAFRAAVAQLPAEWDVPARPGAGLAPPAGDELVIETRDDGVRAGGPEVPGPRRPVEISHVELVDSNGRNSWRIDLSAPAGSRPETPGVA
ncbi:hypothetical protein ACPCHT_21635 [Nucisporomicrobium flavum]|uniref:hypothetical protein n=2 Tax=Nucisporomicrobium flavum TaxID=2785915 RepID=UPI0018F6D81D